MDSAGNCTSCIPARPPVSRGSEGEQLVGSGFGTLIAEWDLPAIDFGWWGLAVNAAGTQLDLTACNYVRQYAISGSTLAQTPYQYGTAPAALVPTRLRCDAGRAGFAYVAKGDGWGICKLDLNLAQVTSWGTNGCVSGGSPTAQRRRTRV